MRRRGAAGAQGNVLRVCGGNLLGAGPGDALDALLPLARRTRLLHGELLGCGAGELEA